MYEYLKALIGWTIIIIAGFILIFKIIGVI